MISVKRLLHGAVAITASLFFTRCSSVSQTLDVNKYYKRDLNIVVNGKAVPGVSVLEELPSYTIGLGTDDTISLLLLRSCHREVTFEKVGCSGGLFKKKSCFSYNYVPVSEIEVGRVCPLRIEAYKSDDGKHGWGMLEFKDPAYTIPFKLSCNGNVSLEDGVGVCQGRTESVQRVRFNEPVRFAPAMSGCEMPKKVDDSYELTMKKGECLYHFDTKDGKMGRILFLGFDAILVRETQ